MNSFPYEMCNTLHQQHEEHLASREPRKVRKLYPSQSLASPPKYDTGIDVPEKSEDLTRCEESFPILFDNNEELKNLQFSTKKLNVVDSAKNTKTPPPLLKENDHQYPSFTSCENSEISLLLAIKEEEEEQVSISNASEETTIKPVSSSSMVEVSLQQIELLKKKRKLIDYEKCRGNDHERILSQRHAPAEFKASKNTFGMPTCYTLDKCLEETSCRRFGPDNDNSRSSIDLKEEEREDRIDFLFKVKPKHQRRKSMSDPAIGSYTNHLPMKSTLRKNKSTDSFYLRHGSSNDNSTLPPRKSAIIKQLLNKSKRRRKQRDDLSCCYDSIIAAGAAAVARAAADGTNIPECIQITNSNRSQRKTEQPINKLRAVIVVASFVKKLRSKVENNGNKISKLTRKWSNSSASSKLTVGVGSTMESKTTPTFEKSPSIIKQTNDSAFNSLQTTVLVASFAEKLRAKASSRSTSTLSASMLSKQQCDGKEDGPSVKQSKRFNKNSTLERTLSSNSSSSRITERKYSLGEDKAQNSDRPLSSTKQAKECAFNSLRTTVLAASFARKLRAKTVLSPKQ